MYAIRSYYETLGDDRGKGRGDQKWLDSHVHEARYRAGRIVRVEGGQHEVPRQRSLDRDLRRFGIPDLPHHDDVGILARITSYNVCYTKLLR